MASPVHVAVYERDPWSPAWNVSIEGIDGVHTFGTRLAQARANVREALALWLGTDESFLEVRDEVRLPEDADAALGDFEEAQGDLSQAQGRSATATARAVRALRETGLSMRDTAELLGLSHQRIAQISKDDQAEA